MPWWGMWGSLEVKYLLCALWFWQRFLHLIFGYIWAVLCPTYSFMIFPYVFAPVSHNVMQSPHYIRL